jgi:hypothetical protein
MPYFVDAPSPLGKVERTPNGGARIPATLARSGLMEYWYDGKRVLQYTPPEVIRDAAATAADVPVTLNHPRSKTVDRANYTKESRGHVSGTPGFNGAVLQGMLVIQDVAALDAVELGTHREVSMGYEALIDETPGTTPEGEPYDWIRTKITYNHAALVPEGRAGKSIRLLLDSKQNSVDADGEEEEAMKIIVDGKEITGDAAQAVVDALVSERNAARTELAAAQDPARIKEIGERAVAKYIADERERTEREAAEKKAKENLERAKVAFPKLQLDGKSADYVQALVDRLEADASGAVEMAGGSEGTAAPKPSSAEPEVQNDGAEELDEREYLRRRNQEIWSQPIPGAARAK